MKKGNLLVIVLGILLFMQTANAQKIFTKKYHKEYKTTKNTTLDINNRYGNLHIENWDKNSISINVVVTVKKEDKGKAEKVFKKIDITFKETGNMITALTNLNESISNTKFSIDYNVKIPKDINVVLSNKYGDLFLNELDGHAVVSVKYGNLSINKLSRGNIKPLNYVYVAYSNGVCNIDKSNWLKLEIKYSKVNLNRNRALMIASKYSTIKVKRSMSIVSKSKYDHPFTIGRVGNFITTAAYSDFKIIKVTKRVEADIKYSEFDITKVDNDFELIKLRLRYGSSDIGVDKDASYKLKAEAAYASIHYPKSEKVNKIIDQTESKIWGTIGKNHNTKSKILIDTKYGSVSIEEVE